MPSSLAAALAASKQTGATKLDPPRPSSLMQHTQKKREPVRKSNVDATTRSQEKRTRNRNNGKGSSNNGNPHKQTSTAKKGGKFSDDRSPHRPITKKGREEGGNIKTPAQTNEIVFVCDIPSDSDDSDYNDKCDGINDYIGSRGDSNDNDFVNGDAAHEVDDIDKEEGECDSEIDDLDLDVVVIMDGSRTHYTNNASCQNEDRSGREVRDGKEGGSRAKVNGNNWRNVSGGKGKDRATPKQRNAGRGKDRNDGRQFKGGNSARGARADKRVSAIPTNSGLMPTPWTTKAHTTKHDHGNHRHQQRKNNNHAQNDQHPKDNFDQHVKHNSPSNRPSFVPASSLVNSKDGKAVAVSSSRVESVTLKGRWADENSSDDE